MGQKEEEANTSKVSAKRSRRKVASIKVNGKDGNSQNVVEEKKKAYYSFHINDDKKKDSSETKNCSKAYP